jgi:hypothetical protein
MKKQFEIKQFLSDNRDAVIAKHEALTQEKFYNGVTLKAFMMDVMDAMQRNGVRSEARAAKMLPMLMGSIYFNNSTLDAPDRRTNELRAKYNNTAYMAMV